MTREDSKYWLAFASVEKVGSVFIKTLFEHFGSIKSAWCAGVDELYKVETLTKGQINDFLEARKQTEPDRCLEYIQNKKIKYITYTDADYPYLLKQIHNPPMTLFYKGDLSRCNFKRTLSVVGSRKASEAAKTVLTRIIDEFRNTDICIVSGLAAGIDTCAHQAAVKNNLATIGVIASGFDFIYPKQNRPLYDKIENEGGVIFSEYWPTFEPLPWRFPHRNRIVTGLSKGTLVAEAAMKSGALISANLCLEQNRELMCIPGLLTNPNTEGIYKLIKNGAAVVTRAQDILDALGWQIETFSVQQNEKEKTQSAIDSLDMTEEEKAVFELLAANEMTIDSLMAQTGIDFGALTVILMNLELKGYVKQTDGGKYLPLVNMG